MVTARRLILAVLFPATTAFGVPALVNITGNVVFTSSSNLIMEFEGPTRGTQYDAIDVAGTAVLNGKISLELLAGYQPQDLVQHRILSAGTRAGVFASVSGIIVDSTHSLAVTYVNHDVFVTAARPGDADVDGDVDFDDLLVVAQNYETSGTKTWQSGDFTGNAVVNFDDLLLLAQHYNASMLNGLALPTASKPFAADYAIARSLVPEPASMSCLAAIMPMRRRR